MRIGLASPGFRAHHVHMAYVTIEANPLPENGRALVTLLPGTPRQTNWEAVEATFGSLARPSLDSCAWQREIRGEWEHR